MMNSDRRPFSANDDRFLIAAEAGGVPYRVMARALRRSVASVRGRVRNLKAGAALPPQTLPRPCRKGGMPGGTVMDKYVKNSLF